MGLKSQNTFISFGTGSLVERTVRVKYFSGGKLFFVITIACIIESVVMVQCIEETLENFIATNLAPTFNASQRIFSKFSFSAAVNFL